MKLLRVGPQGQEKPAILDNNGVARDLSAVINDIDGSSIGEAELNKLRDLDLSTLPALDSNERIGSCVAKVGKFVCVGLNYADHAAETGAAIPTEPEVFNKWTSSICGPNDDIIKPKNSTKLDWEVELGIVVGKTGRYIDEADAEAHIAGYCLINDVSERNFQLECGSQWDKGKGCDTFGPIGPWLVTKDEVDNVLDLAMYLEVNGKRFQNGNSKTMIFSPNFIVSYLSQFMTLEAGDVITTGTPPGVGLGQTPPLYLNIGDKIELSIAGLGKQNQTVVEYSANSKSGV